MCQNENRHLDAVGKLEIPQSHIFVDKINGPAKKSLEDFKQSAKWWKKGKLRTKDFMAATGLTETNRFVFLKST
ncbi:MAG: hypothetical protein FWB80_10835 [Defluviitaleaceae bacterium]|nr:hypothetical protein [Defluviitaleaceae bacterium]